MLYYFSIMLFIIGIVFGSFFNVVGLRIPNKESFIKGRSYCPHCKTSLRAIDLIPIVSFLMQRGTCRYCNERISMLYPTIELFTGLLFLYSYIQFGWQPELVTALLLMSMLMILFVTDLTYMLIPNKVLLFFLPFFIIMRIVSPLTPWYDSLIGAIVGFGLLALIIIVSKGGMGAGDMKFFGVLGFILGWQLVLLTFFLSALFGAIIGLFLMAIRRVKKGQPIPFGPYIVAATIVSYFFGEQLLTIYRSFF